MHIVYDNGTKASEGRRWKLWTRLMAEYWLINVLVCRKKGYFTMLSDIVYTENRIMICMELFSLGVKLETTMLWISSVGISTWKRTCMSSEHDLSVM